MFVNRLFFILRLIGIVGLIFGVEFIWVEIEMKMGMGMRGACWTMLLMLAWILSFFYY